MKDPEKRSRYFAVLSDAGFEMFNDLNKDGMKIEEIIKRFEDRLIKDFELNKDLFSRNNYIGGLLKQIRLYHILLKSPNGLTRDDLVKETGIRPTTLWENLYKLKIIHKIERIELKRDKRPLIVWKSHPI